LKDKKNPVGKSHNPSSSLSDQLFFPPFYSEGKLTEGLQLRGIFADSFRYNADELFALITESVAAEDWGGFMKGYTMGERRCNDFTGQYCLYRLFIYQLDKEWRNKN